MNPAMSPKLKNRRITSRYAVSAPLQYRAAAPTLESVWKSGHTRDMSAGGILIDPPEAARWLDIEVASTGPGYITQTNGSPVPDRVGRAVRRPRHCATNT